MSALVQVEQSVCCVCVGLCTCPQKMTLDQVHHCRSSSKVNVLALSLVRVRVRLGKWNRVHHCLKNTLIQFQFQVIGENSRSVKMLLMNTVFMGSCLNIWSALGVSRGHKTSRASRVVWTRLKVAGVTVNGNETPPFLGEKHDSRTTRQ